MRRSGGGRTNLQVLDPTLPGLLEALLEPLTLGDPESPLRWTYKSARIPAAELTKQNHRTAMRRSPHSCVVWTKACREIERPKRVRNIQTAMRSSSLSISRYAGLWPRGDR